MLKLPAVKPTDPYKDKLGIKEEMMQTYAARLQHYNITTLQGSYVNFSITGDPPYTSGQ